MSSGQCRVGRLYLSVSITTCFSRVLPSGGGAAASAGRGGRIQGDLVACTHPQDILSIVCDSGDSFDAIHTATAIHRLATHGKWGSTRGEPPDELLRDPRFAQLMSLVEAQGLRIKKSDGESWVPGDYGTLRIAEKGTEQFFSLQTGEIWNGRIAMLAVLGYVLEEFFTKVPVANTIPFF